MAKHGHIHTRFNAHSKGTLLPIRKGYIVAKIEIAITDIGGQVDS